MTCTAGYMILSQGEPNQASQSAYTGGLIGTCTEFILILAARRNAHPKSLIPTHAERPYWDSMELYENESALKAFVLSWTLPYLGLSLAFCSFPPYTTWSRCYNGS
jgi:hypothetical protein